MSDPATGILNVPLRPDRTDLYMERTARAVEYASGLGCIGVNIGVGPAPEGVDPGEIRATLISNMQHAAEEFGKVGVVALVEAINTRDRPGFFVHTTKQSISVIEEANHPNLAVLYDVYHIQIMEGDLALTVKENLPMIKHIQIADTPGRHEPGTGEINYNFLLPYLDEIGYDGWVGCEYGPSGDTERTLGWASEWL